MKSQPTALAAAFAKAGMNAAEARLRGLAADALKKHHRNIGRALPTFEAAIDDDPDLIRAALLHYLCRVDAEAVAGQTSFDPQRSHAGDRHPPLANQNSGAVAARNGAGHFGQDTPAFAARPVREPSPQERAIAGTAAARLALTILDTFRVRDGRPIGDVRYGELDRLRGLNAMEAAVIRQIQDHAKAPHDARVRDVVKATDLNRMIQKAAEIADAS